MPENLNVHNPQPIPLDPKHPTTGPPNRLSASTQTFPRTHVQAATRFRQHWQARQYAAAADYAALAHTLAIEAGDVALAEKYAHARQLAHKYQALRVEMRKISWQVAVDPILEPDDPSSSEARCNMVCNPDRPQKTQLQRNIHRHHHQQQSNTQLPQPPAVAAALQPSFAQRCTSPHEGMSCKNTTVNQSQPIRRYDEPRPAPGEMDIDGTVCCVPITWAPWRRKR